MVQDSAIEINCRFRPEQLARLRKLSGPTSEHVRRAVDLYLLKLEQESKLNVSASVSKKKGASHG